MGSEKATTRAAKRLATRERLFEAAVAEFKRTGVAAADVGAIVEAVGVAHGTFFFHIPTKGHVVAELGQREEVRMARALERFLAEPRPLRETLIQVVRMATSLERRVGTVLFKDMLALYFSPNGPELRLWSDHPVIARVVAEFDRASEQGELDPEADPANSAVMFLLGLYALLVTHERNSARAGVLEQFVSTALRGLEAR
jgi:TetR/AcrR family transcriptional repressor of uid operon